MFIFTLFNLYILQKHEEYINIAHIKYVTSITLSLLLQTSLHPYVQSHLKTLLNYSETLNSPKSICQTIYT